MGASVGPALNSANQKASSSHAKISYDGLFNENYFEIQSKETSLLLNLELSHAKTRNPFNNRKEYFIGLTVKSKYDGEKINEPIDISIALDISGSMSCPINLNLNGISRIELAKDALNKLILNLKDEDQFALLTFNEEIENIYKLSPKKELLNSLNLLKKIEAGGGTDLVVALQGAIDNLKKSKKNNKRIILITDMYYEQNDKLFELYKKCTNEYNIPITIIAISSESNTELAHALSIEKGCNYFSVQKDEDLENFLVKNFQYVCFPVAYNFFIEFESQDMIIDKCFGTGYDILVKENEEKDDKSFCKVSSCFPSEVVNKDLKYYQKGGLILLKVKPKNQESNLKIPVNISLYYTDKINEKFHQNYQHIFNTEDIKIDNFSNQSIENAVSLYYFGFIMDKFLPQNKEKNEEYCTIYNRDNIEKFLNYHYKEFLGTDLKKEYLRQLNEVKNKVQLKKVYLPQYYYYYIPYSYMVENVKVETIILEQRSENLPDAPSAIN